MVQRLRNSATKHTVVESAANWDQRFRKGVDLSGPAHTDTFSAAGSSTETVYLSLPRAKVWEGIVARNPARLGARLDGLFGKRNSLWGLVRDAFIICRTSTPRTRVGITRFTSGIKLG